MSVPLLFTALPLRGRCARNRVVISPMSMASAGTDGLPTAWHFAHLSKFAFGGAGIVFTECSAVDPRGRITHADLGLWSEQHAAAFRPIVEFIQSQGALAGIQIGHAGRRGASQKPWEGKGPLTDADAKRGQPPWPLWGPSAVAARGGCQVPAAMDTAMIEEVQAAFEAAAARADRAGFDVLEVHGAHGYLIHSFLSPIANRRTDAYGGDLNRRMRFALETVARVRAQWPAQKPLFFRVSSVDGVDEGWALADTLALACALKALGVDVIDTSSGGIEGNSSSSSRIARVPGYHESFSAEVRRSAGIATQTVGLIRSGRQAEAILRRGGADLIAVGREALYDPFWALHAAEELGHASDFSQWPQQYGWWLNVRAKFAPPLNNDEAKAPATAGSPSN